MIPDEKNAPDATLLVLASTFPRWTGDPEPGFVYELARRMTGRFRVIALVPSAPAASPRETLDGVEVIRFRYAPRRFETLVNHGGIVTNLKRHRWKWLLVPAFGLSQLWNAWRLARSRRIAVIHAHWLIPQGLVAALLTLLPGRAPAVLVTSHGADLFALQGQLFRWLKKWVVSRATAVSVVSAAMRDEVAALGVERACILVQPMGVDLVHRFTPDQSVPRSSDEILFVGRLVEKKGLRHLIDAMPTVLKKCPGAYLTVVGFGPESDERQAQAARLGVADSVRFVGGMAQGDLPNMYRRAAVFVAPFVQAVDGDREGLGLVAVEAAGCGCPVVVSDLPTVRDVFINKAPAAWATAGSPESLATAICGVLRASPASTASELLALRERFDWSAVAEIYMSKLLAISDRTGC